MLPLGKAHWKVMRGTSSGTQLVKNATAFWRIINQTAKCNDLHKAQEQSFPPQVTLSFFSVSL